MPFEQTAYDLVAVYCRLYIVRRKIVYGISQLGNLNGGGESDPDKKSDGGFKD